ncbi:MAG TPA: acetyl-CoA carboxylase biotin carboxyl carrier protein [Terriglobales bacterium]|nr:acetyl-CoA carboxylase biotin carboxyl carrier protein [Terriglobales bacterium]
MNQKELKELIEFLIEKDIAEFELERGDVKVKIKRAADAPAEVRYMSAPAAPMAAAPVSAPAPSSAASSPAPATPAAPAAEEDLYIAKSPIVGTFYESPSPGAPPFFKIGDTVEAGQILCIIEAMKLMNEIEADKSGEIVKRFVNNGQPVEYGQPLFAIRAR